MPKEELELLTYNDLAKMILEEDNTSLNTPTVFKKICDLLGLTESEYAEKIGDFYTSLTTDKRFILLDNGCWDLKDKHSIKVVLDEEETDEEDEEEEIILDDPELDYETLEEGVDESDDEDDEMADLSIIGEEDDE
jgi:DNA-directed RNA polymerase delta subunit